MTKIKVAILANENPFDHVAWVIACKSLSEHIEYKIIHLTKSDWLNQIKKENPEFCLLKPSGKTSLFRQLYQERVEIISKDLKIKIFPSFDELRIYENKKYFAYWAAANNISHPKTFVFYSRKEAMSIANSVSYPIVSKLNVGASGSGVSILKNKAEFHSYVSKAFTKGLIAKTGPKISKGNLLIRLFALIKKPSRVLERIKTYNAISSDYQKGFVIFQEYVSHQFEWRVVRIGNSFFAHKKLLKGHKASGSLLKSYDNPPLYLLDYVKNLTDKHGFKSVAVDLFETSNRKFLINEIQCIFGQSDPYQMLINGEPGRYIFNNTWLFEKGDFAENECYNLRIKFLLGIE